jgi:hypothetical protein
LAEVAPTTPALRMTEEADGQHRRRCLPGTLESQPIALDGPGGRTRLDSTTFEEAAQDVGARRAGGRLAACVR